MQIDLVQIMKSCNIDVENYDLNELQDCFKLVKDNCCFLFDIDSDRCCYLSPSIKCILGYSHQKFLDKGFFFLKTIIQPSDFSFLIGEIISLVKITNIKNCNPHLGNRICLPFRIKHKNGHWLKLIIHIVCLKKNFNSSNNILLGFIEKDNFIHEESFLKAIKVSSREKEVLKYLAAGNSAKTVATELFISENTVITHRRNLIQKLQVKNSAELIKKGFELNILN